MIKHSPFRTTFKNTSNNLNLLPNMWTLFWLFRFENHVSAIIWGLRILLFYLPQLVSWFFKFKLHLKYIVKIQWTQLFEKKTWFQILFVAVGVVWFIHFSLEVVCSLCPCFHLSTFHLFALVADLRTDDA